MCYQVTRPQYKEGLFVHPSEVPKEWEARIGIPCTTAVKQSSAYKAFHINVAGCQAPR